MRRRIIIARLTVVFLIWDPRNFEPDIDVNKIFYVALMDDANRTMYVVLHYFRYNYYVINIIIMSTN